MKKLFLPLSIAVLLLSCNEWKDDLYKIDEPEPDQGQPAPVPVPSRAEEGQLYNMSLDEWSKKGSVNVCCGADVNDQDRVVWGSANEATSILGIQNCLPESSKVAVAGNGKQAAKIQSRYINSLLVKKFASGTLFTGQMDKINIMKGNASLKWGIPFTLRPKSLHGYACYQPVAISHTKAPYDDKKGQMDTGVIYVVLGDWNGQVTVDPAESMFLDVNNDPAIIGYGIVSYNSHMDDYQEFTINIDYRSDRTPTRAIIVASSSELGDYFTGGDGSTLYLDELRFIY